MIKNSTIKYNFSKKNRLSLNQDFDKVFKNGEHKTCNFFKLIIYKNNLPYSRIGLKIGKKIKSSVERNRIKRIMREIFRKNKHKFSENIDIIVIPYKNITLTNYEEINKNFLKLMINIIGNGDNQNT
jgi:ribonuclease P protein component